MRQLLSHEFKDYHLGKFRQDVLAGLTVGAVALPLALAFGTASGATPAAGLVTAILSGLIIGGLSGAPYQISGPTGAMSAVLIVLANRYGLPGIWVAGVISGLLLLLIGIFRLGRFIAFIPSPVITGFTSGIAAIIAIGQIDNFLGIKTPAEESAALKLFGYFQHGFTPNPQAIAIGLLVVATMIVWPKRWNAIFPASLLALGLATLLSVLLDWPVTRIGAIPQTLLLNERLTFESIPWERLGDFITPTISITALGAIESLLCGAVAGNMTGIRLRANQELIAQGIGNIVIPFFGGVPATAAIARTSVGVKAGGQTRLVSIIHALVLLASMFILGSVMSLIPLAALAGILVMTAWRMNEWEAIHFIFKHRFKTAIAAFLITMLFTIAFDLTQAILVGGFLSVIIFIGQIADLEIVVQEVDPIKLRQRGIENAGQCAHVRVAYLTGPLFFAATDKFNEAFTQLNETHALILSMRGVPLIDTSGLQALAALHERLHQRGSTLMLAGTHESVLRYLERGGMSHAIGVHNIFWSSDQAIVEAERRGCAYCQNRQTPHGHRETIVV